jgi:tetratricopeptide (TPR) repeat protein
VFRVLDRVSIPRDAALLLLLGALAFAAYANSFDAAFTQDSKARILKDPRVREATAANMARILTEDYWWPIRETGLYRPVTTASYLFNYAVLANGENPRGYHWTNFLLHYVNAILVYLLARRLFARVALAFFTAALFAVHPIGTEAVTNIAGRPDVLAASFVLGGLLIYLRATRSSRTRARRLAVGLACAGFLGLFCKENAVVLLPVMLLFDLARWPPESEPSGIHPPRSKSPRRWRPNVSRLLSPVYMLPAFSILAWLWVRHLLFGRVTIPGVPFVDNPLARAGFWTARLTAVKVLGRSLLLLSWPRSLSCDYSYDEIPLVSWQLGRREDLEAVAALVVVLGAIASAVYVRRRNTAVFFLVSFVFVTLLPTSNLIVPIGSIMAERFLYLPAVGYVGVLVAVIDAACRWLAVGRRPGARGSAQRHELLATVLMTAVLLGYAGRSYVRNFDWASDLELWRRAVETSPDSFKSHLSLAYLLYVQDPGARNIDLAIQEAERAASIIERTPLPAVDVPPSLFAHLGVYYATKGDQLRRPTPDGSFESSEESRPWYEKAVAALERAVATDRALNEAHRRVERERGRRPGEIRDIGDQEVYDNLGITQARLGRYRKAIDAWTYVLHLAPARVDVHVKIAASYRLEGRSQEALVALHQSLLLDPHNEEIMKMLVTVYREFDARGCAVRVPGGKPELDPVCPAVENHRCRAYGALVGLFEGSKQFARAEELRRRAMEDQHCPPERPPSAGSPTRE